MDEGLPPLGTAQQPCMGVLAQNAQGNLWSHRRALLGSAGAVLVSAPEEEVSLEPEAPGDRAAVLEEARGAGQAVDAQQLWTRS